MMKKVLTKKKCLTVLSIFMIFVLAGCAGNGDSGTVTSESGDRETVTQATEMTSAMSTEAETTSAASTKAETLPAASTNAETKTAPTTAAQTVAAPSTAAEAVAPETKSSAVQTIPDQKNETASPATVPSSQAVAVPQSQGIAEEDAKRIALNHAGVSEGDVSYMQVKREREDGRDQYDVEFFVGNKEYDYDIDLITGEIISYDYDAESHMPSGAQNPGGNAGSQNSNQSGTAYITSEQAKAAAFAHANVSEGDVRKLEVDFDQDDNVAKYDVEFEVGHTEYEYEINGVTGEIISFEMDQD